MIGKRHKEKQTPRRRPDRRASAAKRGYDAQWRKIRQRHLAKHPLCVMHLEAGYTVAATMVDHIIPHNGDPKLLRDPENLQSLCDSCHNAKTGNERTMKGRGGK